MTGQVHSDRMVGSGNSDGSRVIREVFHPIAPRVFREEYWDSRHLLLAGDERTHTYARILTASDIELMFRTLSFGAGEIRLAKDGQAIAPLLKSDGTREIELNHVLRSYRDGATVILQALHKKWPPLAELCSHLSKWLLARVWANVYITPPRNHGFELHYDTHDVFVLQIAGSKQWTIHDFAVENPLPEQPYLEGPYRQPVLEQPTLEQGALIYLPRGMVHGAWTEASPSIHITLGIQTQTVKDVMKRLIDIWSLESAAIRSTVSAVDPMAILAELADVFPAAVERHGIQAVESIESLTLRDGKPSLLQSRIMGNRHEHIHPSDVVLARNDAGFRVRIGDDRYVIECDNRRLLFPLAARAVLDDLLGPTPTPVHSLLQRVDSGALRSILLRLCDEGLIEIVPSDEADLYVH